jgi:fermentation-respiration switch protein FrsA (DUF1100 family)
VKRILLIGLFVVLLVGVAGAWNALHPHVATDLGGVPSLDAEAEHVRIPVGSDSLDGWYLRGGEPAVVLLLHGYARNHERMWRYGQFLRKAGYSLLAIDFRSSRERNALPTTLGHYELPDAQAAHDWLRARPELAGNVIGVLGESLGAATALRLAAANRDVIAIVDDSGFANGEKAIAAGLRRFGLPAWPSGLVRALGKAVTGHDPGDIDVVAAARTLAGRPVLFIHGERDPRMPIDETRELWLAAGGHDSLWIVPGAGHNEAWSKERITYEAKVTTFFDQHLLLAWAQANAGRPAPP